MNIIQQKSAVAPIVEIRDRNNLPVPGAAVTFSIEGGKAATFGGANSLTLTTNAAGRATAAGLNPIGSGAVHINVSAAFQGQTVAASITQTNVMTAAEAASASSASGASSAAGGAAGGGLSTGALVGIVGGVGAAAAGGVVVAGRKSGDAGSTRTVGATTTTVSAGITTTTVPGGSTTTIAVTTAPSSTTTTSAPITTTTSLPTCRFAVSPTTASIPVGGGSFVVTVAVSPSPCLNPTWLVTLIPDFVTVDRTSATGNGTVTVTVAPFSPTPNFPSRSGRIGVADTSVQILQPTAPVGAVIQPRSD